MTETTTVILEKAQPLVIVSRTTRTGWICIRSDHRITGRVCELKLLCAIDVSSHGIGRAISRQHHLHIFVRCDRPAAA